MKHAVLLNIIVYILLNLYCIILQNSAKTIFLIFFLYLQLLSTLTNQSAQAQLIPWSQTSSGGVPYGQANAHQGLSQSGSGRLGEKTHRTGPVLAELVKREHKKTRTWQQPAVNTSLDVWGCVCVCVCVMLFVLRQTKSPLVSVILLSLCES